MSFKSLTTLLVCKGNASSIEKQLFSHIGSVTVRGLSYDFEEVAAGVKKESLRNKITDNSTFD